MSRPIIVSKADLHLHTTASDGVATVEQLLAHVAARTDLRVIAVTDHDTITGACRARDLVRRRGSHVEVIVGEEVSSREGHIVGLWLTHRVPPGLSAAETVAAIHEQGGLAFPAHPFFRTRRPSRPDAPMMQGVGRLLKHLPFDGIEAINGTPCLQVANLRARRFNRLHGRLPELGGSDAHILAAVGKAHTLFPGETAADLRRAIEAGQVAAATAWYRPRDLVAYAAFWVRVSRAVGAPAL
jgi:predicted metal-dependent phosphoesterase TrpH